ncbi:hypothetical protein GCM10020254_31810 [Streptomyces goshikiensis]
MYIGSSTSSAAGSPYGLRHSTAIISPARPWTQCGTRARAAAGGPRRTEAAERRSAAARTPASRAVSTRQKATAAAAAGSSAYGKSAIRPAGSGGPVRPTGPAPSVAGPFSSPYTCPAVHAASACCAACQTRRTRTGGSVTVAAYPPGIATSAAAAGGSRNTAASSTGKKEPMPSGTRRPAGGQTLTSSHPA